MIIASILLSTKASYFQASLAVLLIGSMAILEYRGIVSHISLFKSDSLRLYRDGVYVAGLLVAVASTLFLSVYMGTSITKKLRGRERELQEANRSLQEQDRLKSEYVLMVSHDLQSPLSAIQSLLRVVLSGLTGDLSEKTRDYLERAERKTDRVLHFVRDLLTLSRIKATRSLQREYFPLQEVIQEILEDIWLKAESKGIAFEVDLPPDRCLLCADRYQIREVFINLLANAVKYTPPGGNVYVRLREETEMICIRVSDNGIGIPAEELPNIFKEFYRASNAKVVEPNGTGLGLALVKYIVERHKGQIQVESEEGRGCSFTITLPKNIKTI